jgi:hypothetical protein
MSGRTERREVSGPPSLRRTQEIFWHLITAPEGVEAGLREMTARGDPAAGEFEALFRGGEGTGHGGLPAAERLDIYANMYFFRLRDALREDYPRLFEAIGDRRFHNLITDYLLEHPSRHPSLGHLGEALPRFVAEHQIGREFPWLGDLARLEWDRVEIFVAPDAVPLGREELAGLPQERAGEARFALVPACRVRRFEFDVARLWRELKDRAEEEAGAGARPASDRQRPPEAARHPAWLRIWRRDLVVYHRRIEEDEARALEELRGGAPLETIFQALAAGSTIEQATGRVGRMMQGWIEDGLLASFALPSA